MAIDLSISPSRQDGSSDLHITPRALSIIEAARYVGLSRSNLYIQISSGTLKARKYGQRTLLLREDLDDFLNRLPEFQGGGR